MSIHPSQQVVDRMREVLMDYQETPLSLAREGRVKVGQGWDPPASDLEGGVAQFMADLTEDQPS